MAAVWTIDRITVHHSATEAAAPPDAVIGGMVRMASRAALSRRRGLAAGFVETG